MLHTTNLVKNGKLCDSQVTNTISPAHSFHIHAIIESFAEKETVMPNLYTTKHLWI